MQIKEIFSSKKLTLSFEVFPPKQLVSVAALGEKISALAALKPDFISVTCGAGGSTKDQTLEVSKMVSKSGTASLTHLTCVNSTKEKIAAAMQEMKAAGIQNVLALRGDIPQGMTEEEATRGSYKHADELTAVLKREGFCVGGACYPEGHPESANRIEDIELLKKKVDAGADFLTTQMFFDNDMLYSFLYRLEAAGMADQAEVFHRASAAWQALLYKADIEMCLRTPGLGGFLMADAQADRQVGALAPEGAFLLMEDGRLRRIRHRVDPGVTQDAPGKAGAVQEQHVPDA